MISTQFNKFQRNSAHFNKFQQISTAENRLNMSHTNHLRRLEARTTRFDSHATRRVAPSRKWRMERDEAWGVEHGGPGVRGADACDCLAATRRCCYVTDKDELLIVSGLAIVSRRQRNTTENRSGIRSKNTGKTTSRPATPS